MGWLDELSQRARETGRSLQRSPSTTLVIVLTLGLGIGANAAVFSLISRLLLATLPVSHPGRLVLIADPSRGRDLPATVVNQLPVTWSYRMFGVIRQQSQVFEQVSGYAYSRLDLSPGGETEFVDGVYATGAFFDTLGVSAIAGRLLTEADDVRGAGTSRVAAIGYGLWQRRYGGAADVVGRRIVVERLPFTIVGILPRDFVGPAAGRGVDIVIPAAMAAELRGPQSLDGANVNWISILARLRDDQDVERATAALRAAQPGIREATRPPVDRDGTYLKNPLVLMPADRGNSLDPLRLRASRPLFILQFAVGAVLLIACANIANLVLARGVRRAPEFALRLALGASRWQIARQLLIETVALTVLGVLVAIPLSYWMLGILTRYFATGPVALTLHTAPDARVIAFTALVAVATLTAIGLLPAARASRVTSKPSLAESHITRPAGADGFLVAQVALSLVVLVGGGLLIRSYAHLATKDIGFDPKGILIVDVGTRHARVPPASRLVTFEQTRAAVAGVPGVGGAAFADLSPLAGGAMISDVKVVGRESVSGSHETFLNRVGPGWLSIYRTPVLNGRDFTQDDRPGSLRVAIVNQAFVATLFGSNNPIGQAIRQQQAPPGRPPMEWVVVGVVANAAYGSLREAAPATMYIAFDQIDQDMLAMASPSTASMSVRIDAGTPLAASKSIAAAVANVNPAIDLTFRSLPAIVDGSIQVERTMALLAGIASTLAILLAAIGLYGVTSYEVSRRRKEIGVRMALGATRYTVVQQVVTRLTVLVAAGIGIGVVMSVWMGQFVAALLIGLDASDPATLAAAGVILMAVGAFAGWLPALSAARIDPVATLRCE